MGLNYWGSTVATLAGYDAASNTWSLEVERDGKPVTLRPRDLVFATGVSGLTVVPAIPGTGTFQGGSTSPAATHQARSTAARGPWSSGQTIPPAISVPTCESTVQT